MNMGEGTGFNQRQGMGVGIPDSSTLIRDQLEMCVSAAE